MTERRQPPETALDLMRLLTDVAMLARMAGWKVNMAMEAADDQSVTFSASRYATALDAE